MLLIIRIVFFLFESMYGIEIINLTFFLGLLLNFEYWSKLFIDKVKRDIQETQDVINYMTSIYKDKNITGYKETFMSLDIELSILIYTYETV